MPRVLEVALSAAKTDKLIETLRGMDGVVGLAVQRGASIEPEGDIVTVQATNDGTRRVLEILVDMNVTQGGSIATSEPRSLISPDYQNGIDIETNETIWDEMAFLLRRDTNVSPNYILLMILAGAVAAVGLWTDTLHTVIGAMVIAPGFEPLLRIAFGFIGGPRVLASRGLSSTLVGYIVLALSAALTLLLVRVIDPGNAALETRFWVCYWSSVTTSGVLVSLLASAAGAVVVTAQRSVLSAGVMIALALIPSMSLVGMALISGDFPLAGRALTRWAVEATCVIAVGALVLGLKQIFIHRRHSLS